MTLTQLTAEVLARASDSSFSSTQVDTWVNLAIKQWAGRTSWPQLIDVDSTQTLVSGTIEYSLPADFKRMLTVKIGTSETSATELGYVRFEDKDVEGVTGYYINPENSKVGILPTPTTTGTIYQKYYKTPAAITASEEPPFPEEYHELCIFFALKKYWETTDDFGKAVYYDREFENMINNMKLDMLNQAAGSLPRMLDIREMNRT